MAKKPKARKQSRRSISVRGETYKRVVDHCRRQGLTASGFVEQLVNNAFVNDAFERLKAAAGSGRQQTANTGGTAADESETTSTREPRFEQPHELGPKTIENSAATKPVRGSGTHLL